MKDSNMTAEWVARQWKLNPCTAMANGDVRTGPVRLSFPWLFKPSKPIPPNTEGRHGATLLFPVGVDLSVLKADALSTAKAKWGDKVGQMKLKSPFLSQSDDSERYAGYEPDGVLIRAGANQAIVCVDQKLAPVVDATDVYPGVWAICTVRSFAYDKGVNRGVSFGLQAVMLVADDTNIGGTGRASPSEAFAGVNVESGDINPDAAFGAGQRQETAVIDPFA